MSDVLACLLYSDKFPLATFNSQAKSRLRVVKETNHLPPCPAGRAPTNSRSRQEFHVTILMNSEGKVKLPCSGGHREGAEIRSKLITIDFAPSIICDFYQCQELFVRQVIQMKRQARAWLVDGFLDGLGLFDLCAALMATSCNSTPAIIAFFSSGMVAEASGTGMPAKVCSSPTSKSLVREKPNRSFKRIHRSECRPESRKLRTSISAD